MSATIYDAMHHLRWSHDVQGQSLADAEDWNRRAGDWARRVIAVLPDDHHSLRIEGEFLFPPETEADHGRIQLAERPVQGP